MLKTLKILTLKLLACPVSVFAALAFISAFALAGAYTGEFVFDLKPCTLCLYQRLPYMAVILFSLLGLLLHKRKTVSMILVGLAGLAFLTNAVIAFYHSGIERGWWNDGLDGCRVSFDDSATAQGFLDRLLKAPAVPCDQIPWVDPILGLTMANYNAALCFGLFLLCAASLAQVRLSNTRSAENK